MNGLSLAASLHGLIGGLALAAMIHPAILLRAGRPLSRGARWSLGLTAAVTALAFGLGVAIYEPYRELVKRPLFVADPAAGMLFETKEHLAFAVLALVLGAAATALLAPRDRADLRRLSAAMFAGATGLALLVVALGLYVSSVASFASVGGSTASGATGSSPPLSQAGHVGHAGHVGSGHGAAAGQTGVASATGASGAQPSSAR